MRVFLQQPVWLLFLGASPVFAVFEDFYFAGNMGNNTAPRKCGNMPYACTPPNMCSQDTITKKYYCCAPGVADSVCWNEAKKCDGGDSTTPSQQQISCTSGTVKYCCLDKTL
tara:strand:+ start:7886 stop:8221 length:336 start_codon:yes stop_codon:yes gene_type:complete